MKSKQNDSDAEINFIVSILMAVTGIYSKQDLPDSARYLHTEQGKHIHYAEAHEILERLKISEGFSDGPLNLGGLTENRENLSNKTFLAVAFIEERYGKKINVKTIAADHRSANGGSYTHFKLRECLRPENTGTVPKEGDPHPTEITLHSVDGKFHPLIKDSSPYNPYLSPEVRLKLKSFSGLVASKWADKKCPQRKEMRNLSPEGLAQRVEAMKSKDWVKSETDDAVMSEHYKRSNLMNCSKGNYTLRYRFKNKLFPGGYAIKESNKLVNSRPHTRFSDFTDPEILEKLDGARGRKFTGALKRDHDRALKVAQYNADKLERPIPPSPKVIQTNDQIKSFSDNLERALAHLTTIELGNVDSTSPLAISCKTVRMHLTCANQEYHKALINGDENKLRASLEKCQSALALCVSTPLPTVHPPVGLLTERDNDDATAKKLLEENYKRCFKLCNFDENLTAGFSEALKNIDLINVLKDRYNNVDEYNGMWGRFVNDSHGGSRQRNYGFLDIAIDTPFLDIYKERLDFVKQKIAAKVVPTTGNDRQPAIDRLAAIKLSFDDLEKFYNMKEAIKDVVKCVNEIKGQFSEVNINDLTVARLGPMQTEAARKKASANFARLNELRPCFATK
ncbi:MAG: hypothetical protein H7252_08285 [Cytophaga sp.]|nr:hypothetical protein [Undibacterium sp.]